MSMYSKETTRDLEWVDIAKDIVNEHSKTKTTFMGITMFKKELKVTHTVPSKAKTSSSISGFAKQVQDGE